MHLAFEGAVACRVPVLLGYYMRNESARDENDAPLLRSLDKRVVRDTAVKSRNAFNSLCSQRGTENEEM